MVCHALKVADAFHRAEGNPWAIVKGIARGGNGGVHIGLICLCDHSHNLFCVG